MYKIQVRPEPGQELAIQLLSPSKRSLHARLLDAIRSIKSIILCVDQTEVLTMILVGCMSFALCGCGGLVLNQGASGSATDPNSRNRKGPSLSKISCGTQSLTGPQSKACSVYLSAAAAANFVVNLSSNNAALSVPPTSVVLKGSTSGGFTASYSGVSNPQNVTLIASAGNSSQSAVIQLYPAQSSAASLSNISCETQTLTGAESLACSVNLNGSASASTSVSLSSSSKMVVVPSLVSVSKGATGAGFSALASAVNSRQTVTLTASAGGVSQTLLLALNPASASSPFTPHDVVLNWDAPSNSTDPVVGYHVFRASGTTSSYLQVNSSIDSGTSFTDANVQSGQSYSYVVRSVDAAGAESAPSNTTTVTVP
jgi:hypothetical protein